MASRAADLKRGRGERLSRRRSNKQRYAVVFFNTLGMEPSAPLAYALGFEQHHLALIMISWIEFWLEIKRG